MPRQVSVSALTRMVTYLQYIHVYALIFYHLFRDGLFIGIKIIVVYTHMFSNGNQRGVETYDS